MEDKKTKIEIKKSHEGKFTKYCGGKVTNECIEEGLASKRSGVRAMAQFAKNSRQWNKG